VYTGSAAVFLSNGLGWLLPELWRRSVVAAPKLFPVPLILLTLTCVTGGSFPSAHLLITTSVSIYGGDDHGSRFENEVGNVWVHNQTAFNQFVFHLALFAK